ncbi:hypothetical protein [Maribacter sp. MJ134]|uniref:hypothetical protein n=1 Tax=Maribacter sp. MJ134 TaxID=2496865 RepID=UPI0013E05148|nr:hypothetical protein [Maribacter sp. MJ134]
MRKAKPNIRKVSKVSSSELKYITKAIKIGVLDNVVCKSPVFIFSIRKSFGDKLNDQI